MEYEQQDFEDLLMKQLTIGIGPSHSDNANEIIEGKIVKYYLDAGSQHLPIEIHLLLNEGTIRKLKIINVKYISINK